MSIDPPNPDWFEEALEETRRLVRQVEVGAHLARTGLTRVEAAIVSGGVLDEPLVRSRDEEEAREVSARVRPKSRARTNDYVAPATPPLEAAPDWTSLAPLGDGPLSESLESRSPAAFDANEVGDASELDASIAGEVAALPSKKLRYKTSPFAASVSVHAAILLVILSLSVATIAHDEKPFTTTYVDLGQKPAEVVQLDSLDLGEIAPLDETNLANTDVNPEALDLSGPVVDDVTPVNFETEDGPPSSGDLGTVAANPTDDGKFEAGNNGLGADGVAPPSGKQAGGTKRGGPAPQPKTPAGSAVFFGTKARGTRFVFVVDNSSSMKDGRLEMALAELVKTVDSLTAKQSFYVIFVSDQTYPMFYPSPEPDMIAATPLNKKRLVEWLPKAILASGKNRELIKAMDAAAALNPHALYLLWDGDMKYSESVRLDVMTHLTSPNFKFTVHTIGMGIKSPDAEQNLTTIAESHGGMYRRVEVPTARKK